MAPALAVIAAAPAAALPTDGDGEPARAHVAAQCAAFWAGAGEPGKAARFRALADDIAADRERMRDYEARLRPAMARLARDAEGSPRARALVRRHARLCAVDSGDGAR